MLSVTMRRVCGGGIRVLTRIQEVQLGLGRHIWVLDDDMKTKQLKVRDTEAGRHTDWKEPSL